MAYGHWAASKQNGKHSEMTFTIAFSQDNFPCVKCTFIQLSNLPAGTQLEGFLQSPFDYQQFHITVYGSLSAQQGTSPGSQWGYPGTLSCSKINATTV